MRRLLAVASMVVAMGISKVGFADVPFIFSYQGFMTDAAGNPVTGEWTVSFSFFHEEVGGEPFYVESADVSVEMGLFSAQIGDDKANPVPYEEFETGEVYLELSIEADVGPVILSPRQRIVSNPFSLYSLRAEEAGNAATVGGKDVSTFVTVEQVGELCVTPGKLEELLLELGFTPGGGLNEEELATWLAENGFNPCTCYSDDDVAAYLLAAGYEPGPSFSGNYADLVGAPDLEVFVEEEELVDLLAQSGAVLMADGSIALAGPFDFAGFEARNLVVHQGEKPPENPSEGQLWWDTGEKLLRIFDGQVWVLLGSGDATDLACEGCVDPDDVSFPYALADSKGGVALMSATTKDVTCEGCVQASEVDFAWAKGVVPGGDAEHALTADSATSASIAENAKDVTCAGCVKLAEIDPNAMQAQYIGFSDAKTKLGANTVQAAVEKLVAGGFGGSFNEGNGTILPYEHSWGLPAYGKASYYIHLMNPAPPKVITWLYAEESTSFATSNNLVVAYDLAPNKYSGQVNGTAGESVLQVGNPSVFTVGASILIHQTVGTGGNGTNAGVWELNKVVGIEGSTLLLAKELEHSYVSCGPECGQAQAVVAASYNQLEVVSGGKIRPSVTDPWNQPGYFGGIVYIRARKIVVKTGGKITADYSSAYRPGSGWHNYEAQKAGSECKYFTSGHYGSNRNCSGGGGGEGNNWWSLGGGGGGGNKTAGQSGDPGNPGTGGQGGSAKGDAEGTTIHFGGSGGAGYCGYNGQGGGIIVLGAETIIVEAGGSISADGKDATCGCQGSSDYSGGGGGAGGTVLLFTDELINSGTISAKGGKGSNCGNASKKGGDGGEGWVIIKPPILGSVNESYAKGVELYVDGVNITAKVGDPNQKGFPAWDSVGKKWGADGLSPWSTGPLDLTNAANWTLGEHKIELKETGGAGGDLKAYTYVIYPFTNSTTPSNDTCDSPKSIDLSGPVTISDTTEDVMGKIKATDANTAPFCGGSGGPDVVYEFTLTEWRQLTIEVQSAFQPRTYIKKGKCLDGEVVGCGQASWVSSVLEPGTYYFFVDGDGNLQKGDFILKITPAPPGPPGNDTCIAPEVLNFENGVAKVNGMTLFSNNDYVAACGGNGPENVYQLEVLPGTTSVAISLEADFAPVIFVAKDTCTASPIACVPDKGYTMAWPTPGTYYLFVDGKTAADKGLYTLTVTVK